MKPSELCVSLETARKLKERGFPQDTLYWWGQLDGEPWVLRTPTARLVEWAILNPDRFAEKVWYLAAPTLPEVLAELGDVEKLLHAEQGKHRVYYKVLPLLRKLTDVERAAAFWLKRQEAPA